MKCAICKDSHRIPWPEAGTMQDCQCIRGNLDITLTPSGPACVVAIPGPFQIGDRVVSLASGRHGVVIGPYLEHPESIEVRVDGGRWTWDRWERWRREA